MAGAAAPQPAGLRRGGGSAVARTSAPSSSLLDMSRLASSSLLDMSRLASSSLITSDRSSLRSTPRSRTCDRMPRTPPPRRSRRQGPSRRGVGDGAGVSASPRREVTPVVTATGTGTVTVDVVLPSAMPSLPLAPAPARGRARVWGVLAWRGGSVRLARGTRQFQVQDASAQAWQGRPPSPLCRAAPRWGTGPAHPNRRRRAWSRRWRRCDTFPPRWRPSPRSR